MDPYRNRRLVLVAMTGALSMIMLDQTVVTVALPTMSRELPLSPTGEQWVVNAYVLAMAALVALGGRLGDRIGGVTTFCVGVTVFFMASVGCGLAPHGSAGEAWIIVARVLQGAGAALMVPPSASIVMAVYPAAERGRAMAVCTGISQVFLAVGPLLGGALTQWVSWRMVFWLNVPVGIGALVLVRLARPGNPRDPETAIKTQPVALLVVGVGATVLAVQQASTWSWTSAATMVSLAVGLTVTAWFVISQLRSPQPLVDLRLFARPAFLGNVVVLGLVQFGLLAVIMFSSLYLQDLLGFAPLRCGLAVLPLIAAMAASAQLGGRWYDGRGVRPPALTGLGIAVAGLVGWAVALPSLSYAWQVPGMVGTGLGLGLLMSPTNTDALGRVALSERNSASGLVQMVRQLGGTLGVAVIGAVVLALEGGGTRAADPGRVADAITVGFAGAALAFAAALVVGASMLPREPLPDGDLGEARVSALAA